MILTFLGTGTSDGIPLLNCTCSTCSSKNMKNNRLRSSVLIHDQDTSILIDCGTDFRNQALQHKISFVDAVFFTHAHADHVNGIDDLRPLSKNKPIPAYGNRLTLKALTSRFPYLFKTKSNGGGKTNLILHEVNKSPVTIRQISIHPIPVLHGDLEILGFKVNNTAYITDASKIPSTSLPLLKNLDTLIINALRYTEHPTHFSVMEACKLAERINAGRTFLTHLCHKLEHETLALGLGQKIKPAYDGLSIEI